MPTDAYFIERQHFADDGGVWVSRSISTRERFVWFFVSYVVDGEPRGMHSFCGPYRETP
jgi:hypothetical protein